MLTKVSLSAGSDICKVSSICHKKSKNRLWVAGTGTDTNSNTANFSTDSVQVFVLQASCTISIKKEQKKER